MCYHPLFYVGVADLNSDPHASVTSTLQLEPSPQHASLLLNMLHLSFTDDLDDLMGLYAYQHLSNCTLGVHLLIVGQYSSKKDA